MKTHHTVIHRNRTYHLKRVRQLLFPGTLCLMLAVRGPLVFGQESRPKDTASPTPTAKAGKSLSESEYQAMMGFYRRGQYDDFIGKATEALGQMPKPDSRLVYWRADARRRIGALEAAEEEFASLGDFVAWPNYPPASKYASDIKEMLDLRPMQEYDIHRRGDVIYRVYYNEESAFSSAIVQALPAAYEAASSFLGVRETEIPVYIFDAQSYQNFTRFFTLLAGYPPHQWWQFLSSKGIIMMSERDGRGKIAQANANRIMQTLTHEMTHILLIRDLGNIKGFPNWLNEGSAQLVAASAVPAMNQQNDRKIRTLLQQHAILPLKAITSHDSFHEAVDDEKLEGGAGDPYNQGFNMTRYLAYLLQQNGKKQKFVDFLVLMQQKGNFEAALQEATGMTATEFYDSWLKAITEANQN